MAGIQHLAHAVLGRVGHRRRHLLRDVMYQPFLLLATLTGNLPRLASYYRTDKWGDHWYAAHYQRHFARYRRRRIKVLEIGVGGHDDARAGGASLRMWKRFFPRGTIYGLDLYDKSAFEEHRITIFQGDQTDAALLRRLVDSMGQVDIVIDDGSHMNKDVLATFDILFPLLPDGASYAIEDTQTSFWPEFGGSEDLDAAGTSLGLAKRIIVGLNHAEILDDSYVPTYADLNVTAVHCYHNLIIIEKGSNTESSNKRQALPHRFLP